MKNAKNNVLQILKRYVDSQKTQFRKTQLSRFKDFQDFQGNLKATTL